MRPFLLAAIAAFLLVSLPSPADATRGHASTRLNLRAGPGTNFPVVGVIPQNRAVDILGCAQGWRWCDVSYGGMRGWASGNYLRGYSAGYNQFLPVESYGGILGLAASLLFNQDDYWGNHYRDRDFYYRAYPNYRARTYYPNYYYNRFQRERWNRSLQRQREARQARERREDYRERVQDRREDRREAQSRAAERRKDWRSREWRRDRWDRGRDERTRSQHRDRDGRDRRSRDRDDDRDDDNRRRGR